VPVPSALLEQPVTPSSSTRKSMELESPRQGGGYLARRGTPMDEHLVSPARATTCRDHGRTDVRARVVEHVRKVGGGEKAVNAGGGEAEDPYVGQTSSADLCAQFPGGPRGVVQGVPPKVPGPRQAGGAAVHGQPVCGAPLALAQVLGGTCGHAVHEHGRTGAR
jgi:hypothetical protein